MSHIEYTTEVADVAEAIAYLTARTGTPIDRLVDSNNPVALILATQAMLDSLPAGAAQQATDEAAAHVQAWLTADPQARADKPMRVYHAHNSEGQCMGHVWQWLSAPVSPSRQPTPMRCFCHATSLDPRAQG